MMNSPTENSNVAIIEISDDDCPVDYATTLRSCESIDKNISSINAIIEKLEQM